MSSRFLSPWREPRLQAADNDTPASYCRRLIQALALALAKPNPDQARCESLERSIIEMTVVFSLYEEEQ